MSRFAACIRSLRFAACAALIICGVGRGAATELRAFSATSLDELRAAHRGQPFIVAFWSITCEPCLEELSMLVELHRQFPQVPVVLVAADGPRQKAVILRRLRALDLRGIEVWQFADEFAEKIRFAIDPRWRGELPQTYFFDARHNFVARTGVLNADTTGAWSREATAKDKK